MNKRHHCYYCGEDLGPEKPGDDRFDDCGKQECVREARMDAQAEREEAHERLDRDMGY